MPATRQRAPDACARPAQSTGPCVSAGVDGAHPAIGPPPRRILRRCSASFSSRRPAASSTSGPSACRHHRPLPPRQATKASGPRQDTRRPGIGIPSQGWLPRPGGMIQRIGRLPPVVARQDDAMQAGSQGERPGLDAGRSLASTAHGASNASVHRAPPSQADGRQRIRQGRSGMADAFDERRGFDIGDSRGRGTSARVCRPRCPAGAGRPALGRTMPPCLVEPALEQLVPVRGIPRRQRQRSLRSSTSSSFMG